MQQHLQHRKKSLQKVNSSKPLIHCGLQVFTSVQIESVAIVSPSSELKKAGHSSQPRIILAEINPYSNTHTIIE
jgi:hypothetical protein